MSVETADTQENKLIICNLLITSLTSIFLLLLLTDSPRFAILVVDGFFCLFIANSFRKFKYCYLFLLHPLITWVASQFYEIPFLQLGDGPQIISTFRHYFDTTTWEFDPNKTLSGIFHPNLLAGIRQLSLGTIPIIVVPEYLYGRPAPEIYFFWQSTFATILISICVAVGQCWRALSEKYLMYVTLFALLSPSFVELRSNLNRYDLLFSALFLFYLVFIALNKKITGVRIIILVISLIFIIISKYFLLPLVVLFLVYYYLLVKKNYLILIALITAFLILLASQFDSVLLADLIGKLYLISKTGGATFSHLTQVPLIGLLFKYLFALLAPFPWHKIVLLTESSYGGNYFIFCMHVLSGLSGVYLFLSIVIKRQIFIADPELKTLIMFGLIMSLSILVGATGYHFYILIYFPFFAPIFSLQEHRISWWFPLALVVVAELLYIFILWYVEPHSSLLLRKVLLN